MIALEAVIVGSSVSLGALMLLFYIETKRQQRFLNPVRTKLDTVCDWCIVRWHTLMLYTGRGVTRIGIHYMVHALLRRINHLLGSAQTLVLRWQRRNRRIARSIQVERTESHLSAIAAHKHATALSDSEKQDLKERSLEG